MSISNLNLITKLSEYLLMAKLLNHGKTEDHRKYKIEGRIPDHIARKYNSIFNNYTVNF